MSAHTLPGGITETTATVASGHNAFDLQLTGQTYVEMLRDGHRVMRVSTTQASLTVSAPPGGYTIRSDGTVTTGASRDAAAPALPPGTTPPLLQPSLQLSSEAAKRHEVDGIACVPVDGHSCAMITVQKATAVPGNATETVYLRSTGGRIMNEAGTSVIRSVELHGGTAKFRLVANTEPGVVTVSVLAGPPPQSVSLDVEFMPS